MATATGTAPYRYSQAVAQRVKQMFTTEIARGNPANAGKLEAAFTRLDPEQAWAKAVSRDGLHTGNLVEPLTAYWILNRETANQRGNHDPVEARAVRSQTAAVL